MRNLGLPFTLCLSLCLGAIACGPEGGSGDDDVAPTGTLKIEPAEVTLEVVNGAPVLQDYTATLIDQDGDSRDVTGETTFIVTGTAFGTFTGPQLTVRGIAAGRTEVRGTLSEITGSAQLTVRVKGTRIESGPANAPDLFGAAAEGATPVPLLAYPDDRAVVPPNLGELDVHWRDTANNDLFEVALKNEFVDVRIYKQGSGALWTVYLPHEWQQVASAHEPMTVTVAGLRTASPATKGTSPARTLDVTKDELRGGIYYWATNGSGILRYDAETPTVPPQKLFPAGVPTGCLGCHALSRDGSKIAITFDSAEGRGGVLDLSNNQYLFPYERGERWNFAAFNPAGTEMFTVKNGQMKIWNATTGVQIGMVPGLTFGTQPEISPDGTQFAYVEATSSDWYAQSGGVFVRSYTEATHTFGAPRAVVPSAGGLQTYYPSWSPDSQWLAVTRNNGLSYDNQTSEVWVVKADGSTPPIKLLAANTGTGNLTNSWARWVPFAQTLGAGNETIFYLTFSSKRAFGTRRPSIGAPQIWMAPFYPARAMAGMDPSGPAIRLPFQALTDNNHIAQWTERVVIP